MFAIDHKTLTVAQNGDRHSITSCILRLVASFEIREKQETI